MYVRTHACKYVCMHACVHVCTYVCVYVCNGVEGLRVYQPPEVPVNTCLLGLHSGHLSSNAGCSVFLCRGVVKNTKKMKDLTSQTI